MRKAMLILAFFPLTGCGDFVYSDGKGAGTVTKFSHKGFFCKTWEGELLMGGMKQTEKGDLQANVFKFSVVDPEIVKQVSSALEDGQRVSLVYEQVFIPWICDQKTSYRVTAVTYK